MKGGGDKPRPYGVGATLVVARCQIVNVPVRIR